MPYANVVYWQSDLLVENLGKKRPLPQIADINYKSTLACYNYGVL
jgi:hypothetical protein